MATEYWYVTLPSGQKARGEQPRDTINRELNELVARGWEPVSVTSAAPSLMIGVMLRKSAS
ncbi:MULTISPECIES: hypothetical protein [unclassified Microbacterium]|uniref:hypothetical protein n=1 Tax=unclassified Microbacterium TaxID=2609290 RepID=UPI003019BAEF